MSWFKQCGTLSDDPLVMLEDRPGTIIQRDKPEDVVIVPPKDPEPDLSTKPKDIVGYCFGYVCPKKHVNSMFENITVDGYKERRACQTCGGVAKPAVIRRTAEAQWNNRNEISMFERNPEPNWGWSQTYGYYSNFETMWTQLEFVHYLDTPTRRKKK